jgi:NAD(P)-dependent dehydrogenase (short-subunit alcohol dehydrogenase family)
VKKAIVVTGTSTGIGLDTARALIARGHRVFGSLRRQADADRVQAALGPDFTPLMFDVTDEAAIARAAELVKAELGAQGLAALVNNAGIAPTGPLLHQPLDEVRKVFEVNVFGVIAVTRAFLPLLGGRLDAPRPRGRIVNVSSLNGEISVPFAVAYSASKHALEAITDGLRRELWIYGIDVIAIEPGNVRTEIWDKFAAFGVEKRYAATDYARALAKMPAVVAEELRKGDPVERVSEAICRAIESPRPKARYPMTALWHLARLTPARLLDREITKRMKIR